MVKLRPIPNSPESVIRTAHRYLLVAEAAEAGSVNRIVLENLGFFFLSKFVELF